MLNWTPVFRPNNNDDMIGSRIPRFILYATVLGTAVAVLMLSMFYGQYRWLARQIMSTSYEEHRALLEQSYERRARAELHAIADSLPSELDAGNSIAVAATLNRSLAANPGLTGLRVTTPTG